MPLLLQPLLLLFLLLLPLLLQSLTTLMMMVTMRVIMDDDDENNGKGNDNTLRTSDSGPQDLYLTCFLQMIGIIVSRIIFQKRHWREKSFQKRPLCSYRHEIKICSQNKCHHHLSNVCENSFRMFHCNWVISDYHSFVWAVC